MTNTYKNVYIKETSTIAGPYEKNGPLKKYFDKTYNKDFYFDEKSFEKAESKLIKDSINLLLEKSNLNEEDIDLLISGDLLNQITASNYAAREFKIPFLGIYNACATTALYQHPVIIWLLKNNLETQQNMELPNQIQQHLQ